MVPCVSMAQVFECVLLLFFVINNFLQIATQFYMFPFK